MKTKILLVALLFNLQIFSAILISNELPDKVVTTLNKMGYSDMSKVTILKIEVKKDGSKLYTVSVSCNDSDIVSDAGGLCVIDNIDG